MTWTSVRARPGDTTDGAARTACLAAFFAVGAQGVHEDGATLVSHFPPGADLTSVHEALTTADPDVLIETSAVPDIDWSVEWKARIVAHHLGPLVISPPWLAGELDPLTTVVIDPGMAFGTGDHATTRGVVRLLPSVLRAGDTVADLGAGSAVLSIAAAKLGATRVYAIELDSDAIPDAEANVRLNHVGDRVHIFEGDAAVLLPLVAPVRIVLANIISSVLTELLPQIGNALAEDGCAIVSGILLDERAQMVHTFHDNGWRVVEEDAEGIWWSAIIARD